MSKKLLFLFFLFACFANSLLHAQENKTVILNLKNGYSIKGEIIEESDQKVKIKTLNGDIFEYKRDEINNISSVKVKSFSKTTLLQGGNPLFGQGDRVLSAGLGFGWYSYGYDATSIPAISLSFEQGIEEFDFGTLAFGGIIGYKRASYSWLAGYGDYSWTDLIIAARGAIHIDLLNVEKLDTYGGAAFGLRFESRKYYDLIWPNYSYKSVKKSTAHPLFALYVGGRYYFTENIAVFGELGYGLGYLTLGLSYKL